MNDRRLPGKLRARRLVPAGILLFSLLAGCGGEVRQVHQPAWSDSELSLVFDHHMHTRFSDGRLPYGEVVQLAVANGCEAIAVSDHSDSPASYSADYLAALGAARIANPQLLILAGLELEMPSYGGREHLGLVLNPGIERELLTRIGSAVEAVQASADATDGAADSLALGAIATMAPSAADAIVIYNHPSREDRSAQENLDDFARWSELSGRTLLLSGAPGHQGAEVPGDYRLPLLPVDRWDPAVARINGTWDQLLDRGEQVWAAIAASDFHNHRKDFPPCAFARNHVTVAERTPDALLESIAAGTFWAGHGNLLGSLRLTAEIDAALPLAYPGATIELGDGDELALVRLSLERRAEGAGLPLRAELVSNCPGGTPARFAELELGTRDSQGEIFLPLSSRGADERTCYLRARVRAAAGDETLLAYTNPIRFVFP